MIPYITINRPIPISTGSPGNNRINASTAVLVVNADRKTDPVGPLPKGKQNAKAIATDLAGNTSEAEFEIDVLKVAPGNNPSNALDVNDDGKFRVPTLRNVALTAPYMHDGSIATLEETIEHYVVGGKNHPNKDSRIRPIPLEEQEKIDLLNFLNSLTDSIFVNNTSFLSE